MPPEASAGVPKGADRKYVPEGIQVPLRARAHKSEQCTGFMCVSYKRKTLQAFFDSRLIRAISSSGRSRHIRVPLTTVFLHSKNTRSFCKDTTRRPCRALKEVPRATCNERVSAKFPAQELCASPMKEKHVSVFPLQTYY